MEFSLQGLTLPLRFRPDTPMTDDALLRLSAINDAIRFERDPNGEILVMTPAGLTTGMKNSLIIQLLANWTELQGEGYAFDSNTGFTLPNGAVRSPDFIIELRSPSDRLPDLEAKMEEWIANGAQLAWLLDPITQSATIYRPYREPERLQTQRSSKAKVL